MAWHSLAWSGVTWHSLAWSGILWHGLAWSGMVGHGLAWSAMVWHGLVWSGMIRLDFAWGSFRVRVGVRLGIRLAEFDVLMFEISFNSFKVCWSFLQE